MPNAPYFMDSFLGWKAPTDVDLRFPYSGGGNISNTGTLPPIGLPAGHPSTKPLYMFNASPASEYLRKGLYSRADWKTTVATDPQGARVGARICFDGTNADSDTYYWLFQFNYWVGPGDTADFLQCALQFNPVQKMLRFVGGIATGGSGIAVLGDYMPINADTEWVHVECEVFLDTASGRFRVWVDENLVQEHDETDEPSGLCNTAIYAADGGNTLTNNVYFGQIALESWMMDLHIDAVHDGVPFGSHFMYPYWPASDTATIDLSTTGTPHAGEIDDNSPGAAGTDTAAHVYSSSVPEQDIYNFDTIPSNLENIVAAQMSIVGKLDSGILDAAWNVIQKEPAQSEPNLCLLSPQMQMPAEDIWGPAHMTFSQNLLGIPGSCEFINSSDPGGLLTPTLLNLMQWGLGSGVVEV